MVQILVIGGGPAGVTAALRARELGAAVTLIERGMLGGICTNDGCVPTRVLARAARLVRDAEQFANYGLVGAPPTVDFPRVLERTQATVYRIHEKKQLHKHLATMGVTVHARVGAAHFTDAHTLALSDGTHLTGDRIIICAGGHARRLDFPGSEHALTHSDVWTMAHLPRSLVVVGGAATGCQLASIFAAFGSQVRLLEVGPRLLGTEDDAVSHGIEQAFGRRGIQVTLNIGGIQRLERADDHLRLTYFAEQSPGAQSAPDAPAAPPEHTLTAEAVLLAVGWPANLDDLRLDVAGVDCARGYISVDDALRTSQHHIFAAGDITGRMMLVQSATAEGTLAAENAVLGPGERGHHTIVPHGGFTDPEYGSVGLTEPHARAVHDCVVATMPYAQLDRALIDGHPEGLCKLIVSRASRQVLGAHIVGEQATETLQLIAAGMAAGIRVEQLAALELAYPTFASIVGLAARQIVRDLGLTAVAPQWHTLGASTAPEWERADTSS